MTKQEAFDRVWRHFVIEGNPRSVDGKGCAYRGPDGAKCAAGLFIADADYRPTLEGTTVNVLIDGGALVGYGDHRPTTAALPSLAAFRKSEMRELLGALQTAHDLAKSEAQLRGRLTDVARVFGLTVPPSGS